MAGNGNTTVNQEDVNRVSKMHQETGTTVQQILDQTVESVTATCHASNSSMTQALVTAAENWREAVKTSVLTGLDDMSAAMVKAAAEQVEQDEESGASVSGLSF